MLKIIPDPADTLEMRNEKFLLLFSLAKSSPPRFYIKSTLIISTSTRKREKHHYEVVSRWNKNPKENLALCAECELNNVEWKFQRQHDVIKSESFSSSLVLVYALRNGMFDFITGEALLVLEDWFLWKLETFSWGWRLDVVGQWENETEPSITLQTLVEEFTSARWSFILRKSV